MYAALTEPQWKIAIKELLRVTKENGHVELMELDSEVQNPGPTMATYYKASEALWEARGINGFIGSSLEDLVKSTGQAKGVRFEEKSTPIGSWGGPLGEKLREDFLSLAKSTRPAISEFTEMTDAEYETMLETCFKECDENKSCCTTYRVWARKVRRPSIPRLSSGPNASLPNTVGFNF